MPRRVGRARGGRSRSGRAISGGTSSRGAGPFHVRAGPVLLPVVRFARPAGGREKLLPVNLPEAKGDSRDAAKALKRRKAIYLAMHPETKPVTERGGPGRGKKTNDNTSLVSFAADTAAKTGRSRRTVERQVAIADNIPEDVQDQIADSPVAHNRPARRPRPCVPAAVVDRSRLDGCPASRAILRRLAARPTGRGGNRGGPRGSPARLHLDVGGHQGVTSW